MLDYKNQEIYKYQLKLKSAAFLFFFLSLQGFCHLWTGITHNSHLLLFLEILLDLWCHCSKASLDVVTLFGTGLEESHSQLLCKFLTLLVTDFPVRQIRLISDQYLDDIIRGMQFNLFHPILNWLKWLSLVNSIS